MDLNALPEDDYVTSVQIGSDDEDRRKRRRDQIVGRPTRMPQRVGRDEGPHLKKFKSDRNKLPSGADVDLNALPEDDTVTFVQISSDDEERRKQRRDQILDRPIRMTQPVGPDERPHLKKFKSDWNNLDHEGRGKRRRMELRKREERSGRIFDGPVQIPRRLPPGNEKSPDWVGDLNSGLLQKISMNKHVYVPPVKRPL